MPSETMPSTGTTSPVLTTMMSSFWSLSNGVSISTPSRYSHTNRGALPKTLISIFFESSWVFWIQMAAEAQAPADNRPSDDRTAGQANADDE